VQARRLVRQTPEVRSGCLLEPMGSSENAFCMTGGGRTGLARGTLMAGMPELEDKASELLAGSVPADGRHAGRGRVLRKHSSHPARAIERKQLPWFGQTLQDAYNFLAEAMFRASNKVSDRARHQNIPGSCLIHDARRRVHRDSHDVATDDFALTGVDANPEIDPDALQRTPNCHGELNRPTRTIENKEESVARGIDLAPVEGSQMLAHEVVMVQEQRAPR